MSSSSSAAKLPIASFSSLTFQASFATYAQSAACVPEQPLSQAVAVATLTTGAMNKGASATS